MSTAFPPRIARDITWLIAIGSALLLPRGSDAAENAEAWRAVTRIRGSITVDYQTWIREAGASTPTTAEYRETSQTQFVLALDRGDDVPLPPGLPPEMASAMRAMIAGAQTSNAQVTWRAESATVSGTYRQQSTVVPYGSTTGEAGFSGEVPSLKDFHFVLTPATGVWQIVSPGQVREPYVITRVHTGDDPGTTTERVDRVQSVVFDGKVTGQPAAINATYRDEGQVDRKPTRGFRKDARLRLWPEMEDVGVEVTIQDYAKWRPKGSIASPATAGNHLVARATLVPKGQGRTQDLPAVKYFRFELLDTSREPGVCLNWPLNAKDEDYDLRLAAAPRFAAQLSDQDQTSEVAQSAMDDRGRPYAESRIDSYDFGGRSSLRVTCVLVDGREILGVMKEEGGEQDLIRLPKMKGPDWIADAWRQEKDVGSLAANDDAEKVEGQQHDGDGYTLYEEYRGWAVNGRHVEGDPKRKDFFVQDLGADAQRGIALFEALSKLRVHSKLRRSEMSQTTRLMNGNHRDAPHRVDQHGVWVKNFTRSALGDNGAQTPVTKAGVAGRPGITVGVGLLARHDAESLFNQPFNLPARDTIFAYDRAIAHELLHSVGVEHHGPTDKTGYALKFIPPKVPENKIGRPHYQTGDGTPFTVLQENGHDLAASVYVHYAETTAKFRSVMMDMLIALWSSGPAGSSDPAEARRMAEASMRGAFDQVYQQKGIVGLEHGEHSGDQDCVMRYYFARFYEAKGRKDTLYVVAPGTERIGIDICHAATGTGVNAPGRQPQSRYGNAASGEGDCFSQICPNDAIPPRKTKS